MEPDLAARFWAKVDKRGPSSRFVAGRCWVWTASTDGTGYGKIKVGQRLVPAHRISYEDAAGPIPDGLQLDHLCRRKRCVRPSHLEPVTQRENLLRAPTTLPGKEAARTACVNGHPWDKANTYWWRGTRVCRKCHAATERRRRRRAA